MADAGPSVLEAEVAALWYSVLGERAAGIDRDFFLSGGDSLKAAELFAAIRTRYGIELDLRHIFDAGATVAGLANLIERARGEHPWAHSPKGADPAQEHRRAPSAVRRSRQRGTGLFHGSRAAAGSRATALWPASAWARWAMSAPGPG